MLSVWDRVLKQARRNQEGFTLIELMVVVTIVALLAVITLPLTAGALEKAKASRSEAELREIQVALELYYADYGYYPNKMVQLTESYLRSSFTFETPHSSKKKPIYYLYAVDDNHDEKAQAYVLADPGPSPVAGKHLGAAGGLPNGLKPGSKTYAYSWACNRSVTTKLTVDPPMDCTTTNMSLAAYRTDLLPRMRTEE